MIKMENIERIAEIECYTEEIEKWFKETLENTEFLVTRKIEIGYGATLEIFKKSK